MHPLVSIIVPVRGDAAALERLLAQIAEESAPAAPFEVIVSCASDSMAPDEALARLQSEHRAVRWVTGPPGRGTQLNAGAAYARGEWLWFVHADSRLPQGWLPALCNLADGPDEVIGGSFRFALDSDAWQARLLERGVALRVRWCNLPYGDQGIFVRRHVFERLNGFARIPLMEDVEFIGRLKRCGRMRHLSLQLTTSARRWHREGWWRRSAGNVVTLALYRLGVSPERLARRYYGGRS